MRSNALDLLCVAWLTILSWSWCAPARAQLDLRHIEAGPELTPHLEILEDPSAAMSLAEVEASRDFQAVYGEVLLGYTRSAYWLRFEAVNPSERAIPWLLEVGFPHLDEIDLYRVDDAHRVTHVHAGDTQPFAARAVDHPNFVLPQDGEPGHARYLLRVRSTGTVRIPLRAWTPMQFVAHVGRQDLVLWMFYGGVLLMIFFNLGVASLLWSREALYQVFLLLSIDAGVFSLSGQTFQFMVPKSPWLADRALSFWIATGFLALQLYVHEIAIHNGYHAQTRLFRGLRVTIPAAVALIPAMLFLPKNLAQPLQFVCIGLYMPFALLKLRFAIMSSRGPARFYALSMTCLIVGIPVALLAHVKVIPPWPLAIWAGHIGCAAYALMDALALPARIVDMRSRLTELNGQLSQNVTQLESALASSEQANREARIATRAKDEFMATMSHELRTPLNAIINVPQGLLEDFVQVPSATCAVCNTRYLLDEGDVVDASSECMECHTTGRLVEGSATTFSGDAAKTARFLNKIARSGQHLLTMVNGVLDHSKLQAGRVDLSVEAVQLDVLLSEAVDAMSDPAARKGLELELELPDSRTPASGDAVRIRQVLLNLLSNAIKFSEGGKRIRVSWLRSAEQDTIAVRDEGIGIAPQDHERVFESFEQVHKGDTRKYGGTGLGLTISRSLVRMHGGELWVESELGAGATFKFTLPRRHELTLPKSA